MMLTVGPRPRADDRVRGRVSVLWALLRDNRLFTPPCRSHAWLDNLMETLTIAMAEGYGRH